MEYTQLNHPHEKAFTRNKILESAKKVLAQKKVSGTRMREIAMEAGISMGTLSYHFPSKTNLLLAVLDEMQIFYEKRQDYLTSKVLDPVKKLELFSHQQKQLLQDYPEMEEIFLDFWGHGLIDAEVREKIESMYEAWRRDMRLVFYDGIQRGEFDPGQAEIAPFVLVALLEGISLQYLINGSIFDLEQIFQLTNQIILSLLQGDYVELPQKSGEGVESLQRKPYPTDISETDWIKIAPLISPVKEGGRPRTTVIREVVNALLYLFSCHCPWRMLPHDFPNWQTVYAYYQKWKEDGTLAKISEMLRIDFT
jgi:AcrR family transcriptional regulator